MGWGSGGAAISRDGNTEFPANIDKATSADLHFE